VVSEDAGLALDKLDINALGRAKKVTISKDDTIVLDGAGEKAAIAERCDQLRESIDASQSDYDREKLQARRPRAAPLFQAVSRLRTAARAHRREPVRLRPREAEARRGAARPCPGSGRDRVRVG